MKKYKLLKLQQGFTLAEVMIVVGVLTIITAISFDDVNKIYEKRKQEQEKLILLDIKKSMELYAKDKLALPLDETDCDSAASNAWSYKLAEYSEKYSAQNYCYDSWGNIRNYQVEKHSQSYLSGAYSYDVYYATVHTSSTNTIDETTDWATINVSGNSFRNFEGEGDDLIIKYSDNDYKLYQYKKTLERMTILDKALERYARAKRSTAVSLGVADYDKLIFFPKDGRLSDPGKYYDTSNGAESDNAVEVLSDPMDARSLVKLLGLPQSVAINAVDGKPMWYVSNPSSDRFVPCQNVGPSAVKSTAPYHSPIVVITSDGNKPSGC